MSDLQTVVEAVKAATSRRTAQDQFHIQRALEEAIRHYKRIRFFFNENTGTFIAEGPKTQPWREQLWLVDSNTDPPTETLVEDPWSGVIPPADPGETYEVRTAGYPKDFIRAISLFAGSESYPIRHLSTSDFRRESRNSSRIIRAHNPRVWTLNPDKSLEIYPGPDTGEDGLELTIDYVADIGSPKLRWDGEEWRFEIDGEDIEDTYSNAWFDDAQALIVHRCCYHLWSTVYSDTEKAVRAKALEQEQYDMLRQQFEANDEPPAAAPFWPIVRA